MQVGKKPLAEFAHRSLPESHEVQSLKWYCLYQGHSLPWCLPAPSPRPLASLNEENFLFTCSIRSLADNDATSSKLVDIRIGFLEDCDGDINFFRPQTNGPGGG